MKFISYELFINDIFVRSYYNINELTDFLHKYIDEMPFNKIEVVRHG